jgi:hypothetical protein
MMLLLRSGINQSEFLAVYATSGSGASTSGSGVTAAAVRFLRSARRSRHPALRSDFGTGSYDRPRVPNLAVFLPAGVESTLEAEYRLANGFRNMVRAFIKDPTVDTVSTL